MNKSHQSCASCARGEAQLVRMTMKSSTPALSCWRSWDRTMDTVGTGRASQLRLPERQFGWRPPHPRRRRRPSISGTRFIRAADLDSGPVWVWLSAAVPGKALFCVLKIDTLSHRVRPCASPAPKNKSVLVACSLERYARHTQTVNLYAPLTLRFGLTHGRPCPQVWSGRRLAGPRCRSCLPYACV